MPLKPASTPDCNEKVVLMHSDEQWKAFLRRIPKTDLHIHLLGSIRLATIGALANKHGVPLPVRGVDKLYEYADFPQFLEVLRVAAQCLVNYEDFSRVAYEVVEDAHVTGNCRHLELFFNPTEFFFNDVSYGTMVDGLIAGMQAAERDFGVTSLLIPCIDREKSAQLAEDMVAEVVKQRRNLVVGIGMDFAEGKGPPERFINAYRLAERGGLRRTAHVCEDNQPLNFAPPRHLRVCIEELKCDRVDHGYNLLADPVDVMYARDLGVKFCVTVCTAKKSNAANRPKAIKLMHDAGLIINIGTDDPYLHHTDLAHSWTRLFEHTGWGIAEARQLALAGVEATWLDESNKRNLKASFAKEIDQLIVEFWPHLQPAYINGVATRM
ncbi:hypothetical protein PQQ52_03940 [Paraburkholderia sediminicola]|uniref:adenosine deaminase family protein n=1 Tax=Paraburkholderia sediminicola TaxID=458836 RepID=UPI0038B6C032